MAKTKKRGRGGRKPGSWVAVKPEQIRAYRENNNLSRASFAEAAGVSSTTIQNWETGAAVATPKLQERVKGILLHPPRTASKAHDRNGVIGHAPGYDSRVEATGRIVAAVLSREKGRVVNIGTLIREVQAAL